MRMEMKVSILIGLSFSLSTRANSTVEQAKESHRKLYRGIKSQSLRKRNLAPSIPHIPIPPGPRIVGGIQAEEDEFPWFVDWSGCGASLIHPQVILSAAHCDEAISNSPLDNLVYVGAYDIAAFPRDGEERTLIDRISHEYYNPNTLAYDFMVGKLDAPVNDVPILPLNSNGDIPMDEQDLVVMGHGTLSSGGSIPSKLRKVTVDYVPTDQCNDPNSYAGGIQGNIMMCAGETGKDSCQGDSGGPLVKCDSNGENCVQVGIVSWGYGCGDVDYPGVYARVSGEIAWIQQKVCELTIGQANQPEYCDGLNITPFPTPVPPTPAPTPGPPGEGQRAFRLELNLDRYPSEITWALFEDGTKIRQGGPYSDSTMQEQRVVVHWNLDVGKDYTFEVYDSFGDGLCCGFGRGSYAGFVEYLDGTETELFSNTGEFTDKSTQEFTLEDTPPILVPPLFTPSPTPLPTPLPATPLPTPASTPPPTPQPTPSPTPAPTSAPTPTPTIPPTLPPTLPPTIPPTIPPTPTPTPTPDCTDGDEEIFIDVTVGNQNCGFLKIQPRYDYLCRFVEVAAACKATCNVCDLFDLS